MGKPSKSDTLNIVSHTNWAYQAKKIQNFLKTLNNKDRQIMTIT